MTVLSYDSDLAPVDLPTVSVDQGGPVQAWPASVVLAEPAFPQGLRLLVDTTAQSAGGSTMVWGLARCQAPASTPVETDAYTVMQQAPFCLQVSLSDQVDPETQHPLLRAMLVLQDDVHGGVFEVLVPDPSARVARRHSGQASGGGAASSSVVAPMPGQVLAVQVKVGDSLTPGQALVVMESMKMELVLSAPKQLPEGAVVKTVSVAVGEKVEAQSVLVAW